MTSGGVVVEALLGGAVWCEREREERRDGRR
jgi:hypothetical protein